MDVNYLSKELRQDEPHPFQPALTVRTRVISAAQPGFVVTDAGTKEVDGYRGPIDPEVLSAEPGSTRYSLVGDDLGRIDFLDSARVLPVGATVEVVPPHCYQTVPLYSVYHCVAGDELVDIWRIEGLRNW
jgi:D-serine deaminase-like pyridoxal phosphate-dependent protein